MNFLKLFATFLLGMCTCVYV